MKVIGKAIRTCRIDENMVSDGEAVEGENTNSLPHLSGIEANIKKNYFLSHKKANL